MGRSNPRNYRNAPALEPLEDRRMLSLSGLPTAWDAPSPTVPDHADIAPPIRGPISPTSDPNSAATDRGVQAPATFGQSDESFAFSDRGDQSSAMSRQGDEGFASPDRGDQAGWTAGQDLAISETSATWGGTSSTCPTTMGQDASQSTGEFTPSAGVAPVVASPTAGSNPDVISTPSQFAESIVQAYSAYQSPSVVSAKATTAPDAASPSPAVSFASSNHAAASEPPFHPTSATFAPIAHIEGGSDDGSGLAGNANSTDASLALVANTGPGSDALPIATLRGSVAFGVATGLGSLTGQARVTFDPGLAKGPGEARAIAETPGSPPLDPGKVEGPQSQPGLALVETGEETDTPDPRLADLIVNLLPTGRASFEGMVDRFLEPLDDLTIAMPGWDASIGLLAASLTVAGTVLAVEVTLRSRRDRQADGIDEEGGTLVDFPGLPSLGRGTL